MVLYKIQDLVLHPCLESRGRKRVKGLCRLAKISGRKMWRGTKKGCVFMHGVGEIGAGKLFVL